MTGRRPRRRRPSRLTALTMDEPNPQTLFALRDATLRIRERRILEHTSWTVNRGDHWVVIGPNGAGKTTLLNSITGAVPVVAGRVHRAAGLRIGMVGPELYRRYLQDEARRRMLWSPVSDSYPVMTGRMVIERRSPGESPRDAEAGEGINFPLVGMLAHGLEVRELLDRPVNTLSTGEMRKVLLIAALAGSPDLLLLDEPFDGLDIASRRWFAHAVSDAVGDRTTVVLATHREDEIVGLISRFARLDDGRLAETGEVNRGGGPLVPGFEPERRAEADSPHGHAVSLENPVPERDGVVRVARDAADVASTGRQAAKAARAGEPLVEMSNVTVRYDGRAVIRGLDWTVRRGENWCVTGPNGSGKTTLLNLIAGDNLQAYANNIRLFGRRRGTGETIWEIKAHIGYVTPYLQARHDKSISARDVVLSGFFDSVGLYRLASAAQVRRCDELICELGLEGIAGSPIDRLSAGQRALVMIARAMVKRPVLLILDEPCDGLDPLRRAEVLRTVEQIGASGETDLIYVTHRAEEVPACTTHVLNLERYS